MGIFSSFVSRVPIEAFAKSLADEIAKRYPPGLEKEPGKRPSVNRLTRIIEDVAEKAGAFRQQHGLGWYGKAKLGNAFRWELTTLGYRKDFVEMATEAIVVHLSKRAG